MDVAKALKLRPVQSDRVIELGDKALLSLVMAEASHLFSVEKPNTRRDKKSGARKRTQHETEAARLLSSGGQIGGIL